MSMDDSWIVEGLDYEAPIALGGCRCSDASFECCEYNVTVFDGERKREEMKMGDKVVLVRHDSIDAPEFGTFAHMVNMKVLKDDSWVIGPRISDMLKRKEQLFRHAAKSALIGAQMLARTARKMSTKSPMVAPFWAKCAAYRIADAISYHNMHDACGAHMMSSLRTLPNSAPNNILTDVYECLGIERATPSLLERMTKSAVGFLGMTKAGKLEMQTVELKAQHLASLSVLADAYYYVGRTVCTALRSNPAYASKIPDSELYALKVALDPDNNAQHVQGHIDALERAITEFAPHVGWRLS